MSHYCQIRPLRLIICPLKMYCMLDLHQGFHSFFLKSWRGSASSARMPENLTAIAHSICMPKKRNAYQNVITTEQQKRGGRPSREYTTHDCVKAGGRYVLIETPRRVLKVQPAMLIEYSTWVWLANSGNQIFLLLTFCTAIFCRLSTTDSNTLMPSTLFVCKGLWPRNISTTLSHLSKRGGRARFWLFLTSSVLLILETRTIQRNSRRYHQSQSQPRNRLGRNRRSCWRINSIPLYSSYRSTKQWAATHWPPIRIGATLWAKALTIARLASLQWDWTIQTPSPTPV